MPGDDDPLDVGVQLRPLPEYIKRRRDVARRAYERHGAILQPRIDAHLSACGIVLDVLDGAHGHIADNTNLRLDGDTRQSATWLLAGRSVGLGRATLTLLTAGFCAEAMAEARTLHETVRLLGALADEHEAALLEKWLADEGNKWVRPNAVRAASDRQRLRELARLPEAVKNLRAAGDERHAAELEEAIRTGVLQGENVLAGLSLQLYDVLSWIGHSRRRAISDAMSAPLRQMATGPHPDPLVRAEHAEWVGEIIVETAQFVGDALGRFLGPGYYTGHVRPLLDELEAVRVRLPIDAAARAAIARR